MNEPADPFAPGLLIFDFDGTLVDSQSGIARSFNAALAAVGVGPCTPELVYGMVGLPLVTMFAAVLPEAEHALIPACIARYREHNGAVEIPLLCPFPGVHETLAACRAAGRTLTVATTKIQEVAELALDAAGLRPYFSLVLGGDSVQQHKPHPALVLRTLAEQHCAATDALVIGDTSFDIGMARGASVRSCGVTYSASTAGELRAAGATYLIDAMPELLPLIALQRWTPALAKQKLFGTIG